MRLQRRYLLLSPKRDPREFEDTPGVAKRKRGAAVDAILGKPSPPSDVPDTPDTPDLPGTPDKSDQPDKPDTSGTPDTPTKLDYKRTRETKAGETVKRATFWLTEEDLAQIEDLQRIIDVPGVPGVPDKSAIVREAIRRLRDVGSGE